MLVQAERFLAEHGGKRTDIAVYGQELSSTTWRLAKMNLAIRGIEADLGPQVGRQLPRRPAPRPQGRLRPRQPPFNISDWGGDQLRKDAR
jgi:hypothetical protein